MTSEGTALSESAAATAHRPVGLRDIPRLLLGPRRVLCRVEDVPSWRWPLLVLLTAVTLIGWATVQTGLIDQEIDRAVGQSIAQIDSVERNVKERSTVRDLYEQEYKQGEFTKLLTRIQVIAAEPATALASTLLVAATLYGVVALTGRKAEWHTLLTICVLAGFIEALRLLARLGLMLRFGALAVYTSPAPLLYWWSGAKQASPTTLAVGLGALDSLDPFRLWFWWVVLIGLSATTQLRGWRAWLVCGLCWLAGAGARIGLALAAALSVAPDMSPAAAG